MFLFFSLLIFTRILNSGLLTVYEPVHLKSLIDVLFCKLHYGFGGNRLPTFSKQVSFSEFIIHRYDVSVYRICVKKVAECT